MSTAPQFYETLECHLNNRWIVYEYSEKDSQVSTLVARSGYILGGEGQRKR
jgi:hypothetical protein